MKVRIKKNINCRNYGDFLILLPLGENSFVIEDTAVEIYNTIKEKPILKDALSFLKEKHKNNQKQIEEDFDYVIKKLLSLNILEEF